jgi:hypothetical protein
VELRVDEYFPHASLISAVLGSLNTYRPVALSETSPPAEARRIVWNLDFRYTPKHGSGPNMAGLEFAALDGQRLDRWLPNPAIMLRAVAAREAARNIAKARTKLRHLYSQ